MATRVFIGGLKTAKMMKTTAPIQISRRKTGKTLAMKSRCRPNFFCSRSAPSRNRETKSQVAAKQAIASKSRPGEN
jgi:hypothetical protein